MAGSQLFKSCCGDYIVENDIAGDVGYTYSAGCDGSYWTCLEAGTPIQSATLQLDLINRVETCPTNPPCYYAHVYNNTGSGVIFDWIDCNGNVYYNTPLGDGQNVILECACLLPFNYDSINCYQANYGGGLQVGNEGYC